MMMIQVLMIQAMILLFFRDDIGLDTIYLNDINLDGGNFDEDNPEKLFMLDFWAVVIDLNIIRKQLHEELLPVAQHPTRVWDWYMTKDQKLWNRKSTA